MSNEPSFELSLDLRNTVTRVENQHPTVKVSRTLAVIGESPGPREAETGAPFSGGSGDFLFNQLGKLGIPRAACYVGNVSQVPGSTNPDAIAEGREVLRADFTTYRPNLVVLMGNHALRSAMADQKAKIKDWRGSLFMPDLPGSPFHGLKCLATYHPAYVLRTPKDFHYFLFDLKRAARQAEFPEIIIPQRNIDLNPSAFHAISRLREIQPGDKIALDIEGGVRGMSILSIARSPTDVFIIAWKFYNTDEQVLVARELARVLGDPSITKVLQNILYDTFVLTQVYKFPFRGFTHDTMVSGWEIYPELRKGLGAQVSIWTEEPFYKEGRNSKDINEFMRYCCLDSAVTYEIHEKHTKYLAQRPEAEAHYRFNMNLLPGFLYLERRGMKFDVGAATQASSECIKKMREIESRMFADAGQTFNPNSPPQVCKVLYDILKFPVQHPMLPDGRTPDKSKRTSDAEAVLDLMMTHSDSRFLVDLLQWRKQEKLNQAINAVVDPDGRMRSTYNVVGTETGRVSNGKTPMDTGANLQTITKKLRHLFIADDNHYMFQCDLSGADGWTVAAHCKALGDSTMWDDYMAGLKPAKIIALMRRKGAIVNTWSREQLLLETADISEDGPDGTLYFTCKRVQHGTNYGLQPATLCEVVLKDGYKFEGKIIIIKKHEAANLQALYLTRYPGVAEWQRWVKRQLWQHSSLPCASGHTRRFLGSKGDHQTFRSALSHEPQANTTYATNLAFYQLWVDLENRRSDNSLRISPSHQVHDALLGQFLIDDTDWAVPKIASYFRNPITIAGIEVIIPFDGGYGPSWGSLKVGKIRL